MKKFDFVIVHSPHFDTPDHETEVVGRKPTYRSAKKLAAKLEREREGYFDVHLAAKPPAPRAPPA